LVEAMGLLLAREQEVVSTMEVVSVTAKGLEIELGQQR
jgi:hypothetical protein